MGINLGAVKNIIGDWARTQVHAGLAAGTVAMRAATDTGAGVARVAGEHGVPESVGVVAGSRTHALGEALTGALMKRGINPAVAENAADVATTAGGVGASLLGSLIKEIAARTPSGQTAAFSAAAGDLVAGFGGGQTARGVMDSTARLAASLTHNVV